MKFTSSAAAALCLSAVGNACLLPEESPRFDAIQAEQLLIRRQSNNNTGLAIGKGDRFDGGKKFPRGLGTQAPETVLGEILSLKEIESAFKGLAKEYGIETFQAPYKTFEKRTVWGGKIGGAKCRDKQAAYFNAGLHARERGSPDNLLYFLSDLLYANKNKIGVTYGGRSYTYKDVKDALSVGIVFLPVVNPDGVNYDQTTNTCWRKNRNPADVVAGNPNTYGVDLNRNFDFLWDFPKKFHPSIAAASTNPASQAYRGRSAFSEPETKNVKWVMDTFQRVRWYLDIHSYTGTVLYGWGSDENQSRDKDQNFANPKYDGKRGPVPDLPDAKYGEYVSNQDWIDRLFVGTRAANAADSATGRHYEVQQAVYLYPTSGASDDYASSREKASGGKLNKVYGYTIEFGFGNEAASCAFYPTAEQYKLNMLETNSAFFEFLLAAKETGLGGSAGC